MWAWKVENMSMSRGRAYRRHHRARMIERAKRYEWIRWWYDPDIEYGSDEYHKDLHERAARWCDILRPCSCFMCGNQRHNDWQPLNEMLTLQERRAYDSYIDQVKDYEDC